MGLCPVSDPMAAITEMPTDVVDDVNEISINNDVEKNIDEGIEKSSITGSKPETKSELKPESEFDMKKLVAMFKKLNPLAKEFFPSYYNPKKNNQIGKTNQFLSADDFATNKKQSGEEFDSDAKKDDNTRKVWSGLIILIWWFQCEFFVLKVWFLFISVCDYREETIIAKGGGG